MNFLGCVELIVPDLEGKNVGFLFSLFCLAIASHLIIFEGIMPL